MNICFLCNEYPPRPGGGIGTFTKTLAGGLLKAGHRVMVVELDEEPGERNELGTRIVTLRKTPPCTVSWLRERLKLTQWLRHEALSEKYDIVETPDYEGLMPFKFRSCPVVVRLHNTATAIWGDSGVPVPWWLGWCERRTLQASDAWIGVSKFIVEQTTRTFNVRPRRTAVVYSPATRCAEPISGSPSDKLEEVRPYVLFVGYLREAKGVLVLADAAKTFLQQFPGLRLVYVGKEDTIQGLPASQAIRRRLGDGLADRVVFTGRLPHHEVSEWMGKAFVLVQPSRLEAQGLVVVEGMQLGIPVIYSKVGPGPEMMDDGVSGFLVDPRDAGQIAAKVAWVMENPSKAAELGANARKVAAERFSLDRCISESLAFYEEVIREARNGRH